MQLKYCAAAHKEEFKQILKLQQENLPNAISISEKENEGFVTVSHTLEILQRMNDICPHTIAKDGNKLVGYALSMHPIFGNEIEVLKPMFDQIEQLVPEELKYIVMGQICISKAYRGKGIFRNLYRAMWEAVKSNFDCIITEVDATNIRSLNAHYAIGFEALKLYSSGGREWHLIILQ
ncbi:MAG: GNAT family N-acetyltransferase [Eudoraea sp.]|nr:GNAT family N-acetyltransferase [Eudoraea sp.]